MRRFGVIVQAVLLFFVVAACDTADSSQDIKDDTVGMDGAEPPTDNGAPIDDDWPDEGQPVDEEPADADRTDIADQPDDDMPDEDPDDVAADDPLTEDILPDETPDIEAFELPGAIKIVVVSDTHFSGDEEKVARMQKIVSAINAQEKNLADADALVNTGDVVSKIYPDWPNTAECHIDVAIAAFTGLSVPYYFAFGNHDYNLGDHDTNWGAVFTEQDILQVEAAWKDKTGFDPYYAVTIKGWKLIFLNSMRGYYLQRNFDDAQLAWFAAELSEGLPVLLFLHHPIETDNFKVWTGPNENVPKSREPQFYQLLSTYRDTIKTILVGHGHLWVSDTLHGTIKVQETASLGETSLLTGAEPHTIIEGKPDLSVAVKARKDL